jgi:hypothetical protein
MSNLYYEITTGLRSHSVSLSTILWNCNNILCYEMAEDNIILVKTSFPDVVSSKKNKMYSFKSYCQAA